MERWKPSVTVAAVIEQHNRFLLVEEHTPEGLMLNNPAGHLEKGESPEYACQREVLEETAYSFEPEQLVGIYLSRFLRQAPARTTSDFGSPSSDAHTEDITYLRLAFCGTLGNFHSNLQLDKGIVRTVWLSIEEIQNSQRLHRSPLVLTCALDYLKGQRFPMSTVYTDASVLKPTLRT
jgi:8-oxo-dGTP pyrophosphatase MutT (NUDIX family)